jgi:hypothetical protein
MSFGYRLKCSLKRQAKLIRIQCHVMQAVVYLTPMVESAYKRAETDVVHYQGSRVNHAAC